MIQSLRFAPETLDWITSALKERHQDEKRFHDESVQRLQGEYSRLQNRIDRMYVDKLDGRVSDEFFDQKSTEWRQEKAAVRQNLEQHEHANQSYLQEGVAILKLANRAAELFEKQSTSEKRRLLDFVLSNSTYGGLRCPSELVDLCWSEVNWDRNRFLVHSPKTERSGKSTRMVPLFPELRPYLLDARETAPPNVDGIFPRITKDTNLRTHTLRLLKRAAIPANDVPRFFQNCRSSCQTDLGDTNLYSQKAISEFLGNSEQVAMKHYNKVRERHFEIAAEKGANRGCHERCQNIAAPSRNGQQPVTAREGKTLGAVKTAGDSEENNTPERIRISPKNKGVQVVSAGGSAQGSALDCKWHLIRRLIADCPDLPPREKQTLIAQGDDAAGVAFRDECRRIQRAHRTQCSVDRHRRN